VVTVVLEPTLSLPSSLALAAIKSFENFFTLLTDVSNNITDNSERNKVKECFIRQDYEFGERLEYDFGEVKLLINGILDTFHIAVLSSPAANFRWAYLYKNQKQDVFMDSHVKFFDMIGGIYKEVVYDNMKNVVSKFIAKDDRILTNAARVGV